MKLYPFLRTTPRGQIPPGELLRISQNGEVAWAIASGDAQSGILGSVIWTEMDRPMYQANVPGSLHEHVLTYGAGWSIHINSSARLSTPFKARMSPGCLIISPAQTSMCLGLRGTMGLYMELSTCTISAQNPPVAEIWICEDWELRLDHQRPEEAPILKFAAPDLT